MRYISTRDKNEQVSAAQAIFRGLAPDGGLYLPESLPQVNGAMLTRLCGLGYADRARAILPLFLDDFSQEEIDACVEAAYGCGFEDDCPAPLAKLAEGRYLLELWHGPTCAFKDMALQLLPALLTTAMRKVGGGRDAVILVATSGDTGKAALEGFHDAAGASILVFYPEQGVSPMQKHQMVTQQGANVGVVAIEGNFDDAQNGVKELFGDPELAAELADSNCLLTSANSINWGRLLPQIVYYFSAYCDLVADGELKQGDQVNFCVPTGNFGNILAAHYARGMGLPVGRLICASNRNDVLTQFIRTGVYDRDRTFYITSSPSMDILISSNLERLLFELCGRDDEAVRGMMSVLREQSRFCLDSAACSLLQDGFWGGCCDEAGTAEAIRTVFGQYGYLCDPHTAVAVDVARQYREATGDNRPMVVVSTASPYKFAGSVLKALGESGAADGFATADFAASGFATADFATADFAVVRALESRTGTTAPAPINALESAVVRFGTTIAKEEMAGALRAFIKR